MAKTQLQILQERTAYIQRMTAKGYIFVRIADLERYRPVLSTSIVMRITTAMLKGEDSVPIQQTVYLKLASKLQEYNEQQQKLQLCAELNNRGIACEHRGDIAGALQAYEENITLGYPAHHAFKRLLVLYRKAKDYANELRVCQRACRVFPKDQSYKERRDKVRALLARTKDNKAH
ncbi:hypothetical protein [uncultured Duncaniella sp.]|uniref:hypothetical protein n=1 Tax=uncultured Duncaniella sp. TaxID=2768039 RepID=UPI00265A9F28|nr:hypothetical protein [uncultured Duncaniella sp.]